MEDGGVGGEGEVKETKLRERGRWVRRPLVVRSQGRPNGDRRVP